jgi:hypothetical protein
MGVGHGVPLAPHELATNAANHGRFRSRPGSLDVAGACEGEDLVITHLGRGGPPVLGKPDMTGSAAG